MIIRETNAGDDEAIRAIHVRAFGHDDEAELTFALLADPSAAPCLSLLVEVDGQPTGHVLFTRVRIDGAASPPPATILAPLAVVPEAQGQGVGTALVCAGLEQLAEGGTGLVFVLGDPAYYRRFGFRPAGAHGLVAPYAIPARHADAWMVVPLTEGLLGIVRGRVACADSLDRLEYWIE